MIKPLYRILLSSLVLLFIACSETSDGFLPHEESDASSVEFMSEVFDRSGGLDKWNKIKMFSYVKRTRMFLPDSSLEFEVLQKQSFQNYPVFKGEILYLEDSLERRIIQNEDVVKYYKQGEEVIDPKELDSARKNIQTAYYVISLPFKLQDSNLILEKLDTETDLLNRDRDVVQIQHLENLVPKNEKWWLFFEPETKLMSGYNIKHDGRYSYIINDSTTNVSGFNVPILRRSIALDDQMKNAYLRADYVYSDWKIEF